LGKVSGKPGSTLIIGAGPAGLSSAYEFARHGVKSEILEQSAVVGGLARTEQYKGYCFDIGGHRFFTKVREVERMWREVLGDDLLKRPRLSRIYYRSKYFRYPIEPWNTLAGLGVTESVRSGLSYLKTQLRPPAREENLEDWLTARFGAHLYRTFFKTYTEKVWGIPCSEIGADWAAQRIRGLSLSSLLRNSITRRAENGTGALKTLIQEFDYPRKGPGMMWTRTRDRLVERGTKIHLDCPVQRIEWEPGRVKRVLAGGRWHEADSFISSMAIRDLLERLHPGPPAWLEQAASDFRYRDFLTVVLIVRGKNLFPDNWIYIHEPGVKVGRIQNYNNWSPEMVPDQETTCLGLEYFCFEGDQLWTQSDQELRMLAVKEIASLGLVDPSLVVDGTVLRVEKAYPVYDSRYENALAQVRRFLKTVPNLQLVGRNGMHRYNNQDHSMLTGMLAARNVLGLGQFDLWKVNADTDYHEDGFRLEEEEIRLLDASQPHHPLIDSQAVDNFRANTASR
jgi:protoporphyrinogen oxidase